ncbi:MAG: hypothetical protein EXS31_10595 [Pedosphaera sp.]|nr:hypothetical protein [Pedosphaera sp.]
MQPNASDIWSKSWRIFQPGEAMLASGFVFLVVTVALMLFVMVGLLAVITVPFALILLSLGIIRARDNAAPTGRQWAGLGLLLLGTAALCVVAFNAASLSYKLAIHVQRPLFPVPSFLEWVLHLGSWLIPALLMSAGLSFWTNWSPRRRRVWCVIILIVPLAAFLLHRYLASLGWPLTA